MLPCTVGAFGSTKGCLSSGPRGGGWCPGSKEGCRSKERKENRCPREIPRRVVIKGDRKGEDDKKEGQGGREWRCKWRGVAGEREKRKRTGDKCEDGGGERMKER